MPVRISRKRRMQTSVPRRSQNRSATIYSQAYMPRARFSINGRVRQTAATDGSGLTRFAFTVTMQADRTVAAAAI